MRSNGGNPKTEPPACVGNGEGSRPWSGGQQDYEDTLGPNRSGGMDKVVAKQPPKGPDPLGPVPDWGPTAGVEVVSGGVGPERDQHPRASRQPGGGGAASRGGVRHRVVRQPRRPGGSLGNELLRCHGDGARGLRSMGVAAAMSPTPSRHISPKVRTDTGCARESSPRSRLNLVPRDYDGVIVTWLRPDGDHVTFAQVDRDVRDPKPAAAVPRI